MTRSASAPLGATPGDVLRLVFRRALVLSTIGIAAGVAGSLGITRYLYDVKPTDPVTFAAMSLLLLAVALLASWLPARRTAKVDPAVALRYG